VVSVCSGDTAASVARLAEFVYFRAGLSAEGFKLLWSVVAVADRLVAPSSAAAPTTSTLEVATTVPTSTTATSSSPSKTSAIVSVGVPALSSSAMRTGRGNVSHRSGR
jgi:hypothetical protein